MFLPDELLRLIALHTAYDGDVSSIRSLGATCVTWRRIMFDDDVWRLLCASISEAPPHLTGRSLTNHITRGLYISRSWRVIFHRLERVTKSLQPSFGELVSTLPNKLNSPAQLYSHLKLVCHMRSARLATTFKCTHGYLV